MNMDKKSIFIGFCFGLFVLGAAFAAGAPAQAQTAPEPSGITYPVPELGNCGSKDACKNYCGDPANIEACVAFGKAHGLMNQEEAARAQKFAKTLQSAGGPGGCRTPGDCASFCSNLANINACVKFAEEQGIQDEHATEGRKLQVYLSSGGKMPGGCTSRDACESYCGDFNNAQECFEFAQKAGLAGPGDGPDKDISPEQARKLMELTRAGQTPGGCRSKQQCESYCGNSAHFEECAAFAEKAGFMSPKEAEMMRKTGGKGPGGCDSKGSCEAFCNDPVNRQACFEFGKEHGMISEEDQKRMQDGMVRMRQGLENAPVEVVACLKSTLGQNVIENIQSGNLLPGPEIGDSMKNCFDKFGQNMSPRGEMTQMPPEMADCVKAKLGDAFEKVRTGQAEMTPEMGDAFRVCGEQMRLLNPQMQGGPNGGPGGPPSEGTRDFLRSAPQEIQACLKAKLGGDFETIRSGQTQPSPEVGEKMKECFESFRPQESQNDNGQFRREGPNGPGNFDDRGPNGIGPGQTGQMNLPPEVTACIRSAAGEGALEKMSRGQADDSVRNTVGECMKRFQAQKNSADPRGPRPQSGEEARVCAQVITPAKDPVSGKCASFPTPCAVPRGWQVGCSPASPDATDQRFPEPQVAPVNQVPPAEMASPSTGTFVPPPTGETAPQPETVTPPPADATAPPPSDATAPATTGGSLLGIFTRLLGI